MSLVAVGASLGGAAAVGLGATAGGAIATGAGIAGGALGGAAFSAGTSALGDAISGSNDQGGGQFENFAPLSMTGLGAGQVSGNLFSEHNNAAFADFLSQREPLSKAEKRLDKKIIQKLDKQIPGLKQQVQGQVDLTLPQVEQALSSGFFDPEFDITPFDEFARRNLERNTAGILGNRLSGLRSSGTTSEVTQLNRDNALALAKFDAEMENAREIRNQELRASFFPQGVDLAVRLPTVPFEFEANSAERVAQLLEASRIRKEGVRPGAAPPVPSIFDAGRAVQGLGQLEASQRYVGDAPNQGAGAGGILSNFLGTAGGGELIGGLVNSIGGLFGAGSAGPNSSGVGDLFRGGQLVQPNTFGSLGGGSGFNAAGIDLGAFQNF